MMSDPEGQRRVELTSDNITRHIVEIPGDIAEEEETNKRRRERADQTTASENLRSTSAPDEVPPLVRAAMFGKDTVLGRKRRVEDDPDDPRSGFGRTLATLRMKTMSQTSLAISTMMPQTQGELLRQDQGPRDQPMTKPTTEAEEMTLTLYFQLSAIIAAEDSAAKV